MRLMLRRRRCQPRSNKHRDEASTLVDASGVHDPDSANGSPLLIAGLRVDSRQCVLSAHAATLEALEPHVNGRIHNDDCIELVCEPRLDEERNIVDGQAVRRSTREDLLRFGGDERVGDRLKRAPRIIIGENQSGEATPVDVARSSQNRISELTQIGRASCRERV